MNKLKIFENPEFGAIRTMEIDGEPWFVGKDVATALGYSNPRKAIADHVEQEDKNTVTIRDGIKGNPNMTVINESGVYSLILSSKLPTAKAFKRWVTSEVLPTIRKTGGYIPATPEMSDMEILSRAVLIGQRTIEQQKEQIAFEQSKNAQLSKELTQIRPAAQFALECLDSPSLFTVEQIAKDYGLSARALNNLLKQEGLQYKRGEQWFLYARYADQGLTHSRTKEIKHSDGSVEYKMYTCWTARGRRFIHELLRLRGFVRDFG